MLQFILYFILAYFLYQLIFKIIIPVYRTTRQIKKGFREMQERMNGQPGEQPNPFQNTSASNQPDKGKQVGDYIDFEEIKE